MSAAKLGDRVTSPTGAPLGEVDDVIVDTATGSVSHVLITFDHVLGLEAKRFAVRPDALTHRDPVIVLDAEPETLVSPQTATLLLV
jgi:sporulation protein YlmC with PRC-barrel domain